MKVWSRLEHTITLDESERWDYTQPDGKLTIAVEQIDIERFSGEARPHAIWFVGPRRLLNGGLSIQGRQYVCVALDAIPKNIWRKLKTAGVLKARGNGSAVDE